MSNYTFGNYLCERREKKGLSQSQLGEKLGVSNKAVSKWENGGAYPSADLMLPLAKALGVTIEELYTVISNSKKKKTKLRKMLDVLVQKSGLIVLPMAALVAVMWILFLAFGNAPDKNKILIVALIVPFVFYGFLRFTFFIVKKNPSTPAKFLDICSAFFIAVSVFTFFEMLYQFAVSFPNGFSPNLSTVIGILAATLHANKNRV